MTQPLEEKKVPAQVLQLVQYGCRPFLNYEISNFDIEMHNFNFAFPLIFQIREDLNGINHQPSKGQKFNHQPPKKDHFYRQPSKKHL